MLSYLHEPKICDNYFVSLLPYTYTHIRREKQQGITLKVSVTVPQQQSWKRNEDDKWRILQVKAGQVFIVQLLIVIQMLLPTPLLSLSVIYTMSFSVILCHSLFFFSQTSTHRLF